MSKPIIPPPGSKAVRISKAKPAGRLEAAFQRIFTRAAHVVAIDDVGAKFRIITLGGEALRQVDWTPGDKIQLLLGGWVQRTYTPLDWDPLQGLTRILVYLHGDGPGANWARHVGIGDDCVLFGPRASIDLAKVRSGAFIFGDETSLGLVAALNHSRPDTTAIRVALEVSSSSDILDVIEVLGLGHADIHIHTSSPNDAHLFAVEDQAFRLLKQPDASFVLTGKAPSIQRLRQNLRQYGSKSGQFQNKAYWAPGKTGLD